MNRPTSFAAACRSVSLVQGRPRQRSSEPRSRNAQIGPTPSLPSDPTLVDSTPQLRDRSVHHVINARIPTGRAEIPIKRAAPLPPTSRGFLP